MRASDGQRSGCGGEIAALRASRSRKGTGARPASCQGGGIGDPAFGLNYGVGMRVFTDRRLLRQIRRDIVGNVMKAEQVAALENVTPEVLIALLEQRLAPDTDSGAELRAYAASHRGFRTRAWRTTRHHASKLHVLDEEGVTLCGTPVGGEPAAVHSGPCRTCAAHARSTLVERAA